MVETIVKCLKRGGTVYIAGNGGSAELANHFAGEFVGKFLLERKPFRGVSLCGNTAILTAIANDFGFEFVFTRQLEGFLTYKDVFIGISSSGRSKNINLALDYARAKATAIDFPRKGNSTPEVQEYQTTLMHQVMKEVEEEMVK